MKSARRKQVKRTSPEKARTGEQSSRAGGQSSAAGERPPRARERPSRAGERTAPGREQAGGSAERLQKILAAAGVGSRRKCEELILSGRVEVDRQVVANLGAKADAGRQEIRLDGMPLPRPRVVHYLVHKPVGVVSTNYDPAGRPRVVDLVPRRDNERLFAVGRLDLSSEGLILLTNDGELANRLTHPRYGVEKTYQAEVAGAVDRDALASLQKGAHLAEGFARVASARVRSQWKKSTMLEIVLAEGRNREIRRLLAREGHKVLRLVRVALGPLRLGELPAGAWRPIEPAELRALRQAAFAPRRAAPRKRSRAAAQKPLAGLAAAPAPTIIGGDDPEPAEGRSNQRGPLGRPVTPRPVTPRPAKSRPGDRRPHAAARAGANHPRPGGGKRSGQGGGKSSGQGGAKTARGRGGQRQGRSHVKGSRP